MNSGRVGVFLLLLLSVSMAFSRPLIELVRYALREELYSHVLLVPFTSLYLVWLQRHEPDLKPASSKLAACIAFVIGLLTLGLYRVAVAAGWHPSSNDFLSVTIFAYVNIVIGGLLLCFGREVVWRYAFATGFLLFLVPIPDMFMHGVSVFLQYASAQVAYVLLQVTGTSLFRASPLIFELPGITIEVAEECSGIRSSLVLFILSFVAGHVLLKSPWRRAALVSAVIPLAVLRNAVRIVTISMLCVHVDPKMINSIIHKRGGPVFFVASLVPFFALLWWLRKAEAKSHDAKRSEQKT